MHCLINCMISSSVHLIHTVKLEKEDKWGEPSVLASKDYEMRGRKEKKPKRGILLSPLHHPPSSQGKERSCMFVNPCSLHVYAFRIEEVLLTASMFCLSDV